MTNKKRDKRIWVRMGWELAALHHLATEMLCDREYQAVMSKAELGGLYRAIKGIDKVRAAADSKSICHVVLVGPDPFYGNGLDPAREMTDGFRNRLCAEAVSKCEELYSW